MTGAMKRVLAAIKNQALKEYRRSPAVFVSVIVLGCVLGLVHGYLSVTENKPTEYRSSTSAPAASIQPDAADVRRELENIDLHGALDFKDYTDRAHKVEVLIPKIEAFYSHAMEVVQRARQSATDSKTAEIADLVYRLNQKDIAGFELLKQEVANANTLEGCPIRCKRNSTIHKSFQYRKGRTR